MIFVVFVVGDRKNQLKGLKSILLCIILFAEGGRGVVSEECGIHTVVVVQEGSALLKAE
jgi:hypothetical protein